MASIRRMMLSDLDAGMRLKAQAGWNQTEADWRRFLGLGGDGCFVAEVDGEVVGSVASCRFGTIGWVAMMLVEKAFRGAGIGRSLLMRCLDHLDSEGAKSVRLDATTLGRPLYESLGFRVDFALTRYRGVARNETAEVTKGTWRNADLGSIAALDRAVTATDRRTLLARLLDDNPANGIVAGPSEGPVGGFALWRAGSSADQVGPCIAERSEGKGLLDEVGRRLRGRELIVDIPSGHADAVAWAASWNLSPSREFHRMTRGEPVNEESARLWASSGPEMG